MATIRKQLNKIIKESDFALFSLVQHLRLLKTVLDELENKEIEMRFNGLLDFCEEKLEIILSSDTKERFIISEHTIEDTKTGLLWERDMSKRGQMNWNDAMKINDNGFTLPSRENFKTLSNSKYYPTTKELEEIGFINIKDWYWTKDMYNSSNAYFVYFDFGNSFANDVTFSNYVLCVRRK